MTLTLEINGIDFTAKWRPYDSHWTRRAYLGEAAGESEFVIDDDDGTINHADLATYKILRVWEDASGVDFCMFEGRITTKRLGRGPLRTGVAMRWVITAADSNYELRGIRVTDSVRPVETDVERVQAYVSAYLSGGASTNPHARTSTEMDDVFVENADTIDMPAETYVDTFPDEVFRRICEMSAKTFFVFIDGDAIKHLYYALPTDDQLEADISITDAGTDDGVDVYAPELSDSTGAHDGLQVITGGSVRYAGDQFYEASDVAGGEDDHDKWEAHFHDDFLNTVNDATRFITNTVASRSNEDFTFSVSWNMLAEHAHRMQAGYITSVRFASANVPTAIDQRATQVTHAPLYPDADGNSWYRVTADFGLPRGRPFQRHVRIKPATPPATVVATCVRLYPDNTTPTTVSGAVVDASWEDVSGTGMGTLKTTADGDYSTTAQVTRSATGSSGGDDQLYWRFAYELDATSAAIIAAGGATIRGQFRARARYGIGISESAQDMISQMGVRVTTGTSTTIRGTALALHSLASSAGSSKWPAAAVKVNKQFPPPAATSTLSAVSGTVAGDWLIVELGARNFTTVTSGGAIGVTTTEATDMPEDDLTTTTLNTWIEFCTSGSGGSTPAPIGDVGDGTPGTSNVWAPIDHVHSHGILDPDDVHMHAEYQVHQMVTNDGSDPAVTDDADSGYSRGWHWNNTTSGDVFFLRDSTPGAADWVLIAPESVVGGSTSFVSIAKWGTD